MRDVSRIKLFEADHFLEDALARVARDDDYSPTVPFAHALDGLILAVDALCQEKGQEPPRRHDDGPKVFLELIRRGAIPEQASQWRDLLKTAAARRAAVQYHGELATRAEARRFVRDAKAFLEFVRSQVR